jgi:hypothetical protein
MTVNFAAGFSFMTTIRWKNCPSVAANFLLEPRCKFIPQENCVENI